MEENCISHGFRSEEKHENPFVGKKFAESKVAELLENNAILGNGTRSCKLHREINGGAILGEEIQLLW
jgi:hypothetical protein